MARLRYRLITGPDDDKFCQRVSEALNQGYVLYGMPQIAHDDGVTICAQAVLLPDHVVERERET